MKRCRAKDAIEVIAKRKGQQVGSDKADLISKIRLKILACVQNHVAREVEPNDAASGKAFKKKPGKFSGAATGIEQALVTTQMQLT
jgi:hypothetical protein